MKVIGSRQAACAQRSAFCLRAAGAHAQPHRVSRIASPAFRPAPASQQQRRSVAARAVRADQQGDQLDTAMLQLISSLSGTADAQLAAAIKEHTEAARSLDASTTSELREKIVTSMAQLSTGLLERETEVRDAAFRQRAAARLRHLKNRPLGASALDESCCCRRRSGCCCWQRCAASTSCCWARQVSGGSPTPLCWRRCLPDPLPWTADAVAAHRRHRQVGAVAQAAQAVRRRLL
jgi:hypothetical protein